MTQIARVRRRFNFYRNFREVLSEVQDVANELTEEQIKEIVGYFEREDYKSIKRTLHRIYVERIRAKIEGSRVLTPEEVKKKAERYRKK